MVKPLTFKGDKKPKKRKREHRDDGAAEADDSGSNQVAAAGSSSRKAARAAADKDNVENDDSWVSADAVGDVSGPVMFVLPTEPLTALACDANGKVFTLPIENVVDGNASTAEPHDVRMVWVANKIAGTENHRFKGSAGK
jgi:protein FRG1